MKLIFIVLMFLEWPWICFKTQLLYVLNNKKFFM